MVISSSSPTVLQDGERWYTMFNELVKSALSVVVVFATGYMCLKGITALEITLAERKLRKEEGAPAPAPTARQRAAAKAAAEANA